MVKSYCKQIGSKSIRLKILLVKYFSVSHLLASSAVWGHILGHNLQLRRAGDSVQANIKVAHRAELR